MAQELAPHRNPMGTKGQQLSRFPPAWMCRHLAQEGQIPFKRCGLVRLCDVWAGRPHDDVPSHFKMSFAKFTTSVQTGVVGH